MYKRIVHYLQGSQLVQIQCACPERVLNLLGARGILFWDLQWESEICLHLRMLLAQGPALEEEVARQTGAELFSQRHCPAWRYTSNGSSFYTRTTLGVRHNRAK